MECIVCGHPICIYMPGPSQHAEKSQIRHHRHYPQLLLVWYTPWIFMARWVHTLPPSLRWSIFIDLWLFSHTINVLSALKKVGIKTAHGEIRTTQSPSALVGINYQ